MVLEILADFLEEAIERLGDLPSLLAESRHVEVAGLLHKLAGSSGTLGLSRFCEEVRRLESECEAGLARPDAVRALRELLEQSGEQARFFLEGERSVGDGA